MHLTCGTYRASERTRPSLLSTCPEHDVQKTPETRRLLTFETRGRRGAAVRGRCPASASACHRSRKRGKTQNSKFGLYGMWAAFTPRRRRTILRRDIPSRGLLHGLTSQQLEEGEGPRRTRGLRCRTFLSQQQHVLHAGLRGCGLPSSFPRPATRV